MPKLKQISCLFEFENALDDIIEHFDPDIKERAIEKIKDFAIECFKIGLEAGMMQENKVPRRIK